MTNQSQKISLFALLCALAGCGGDDSASASADASTRFDGGLDGSTSNLDASADGGNSANNGDSSTAQSITLRFKATLGQQELVCGQNYADVSTSKLTVTPQDFRFFVQEVRLINASGQEVPVKFDERLPFQSQGVALIDFTDGSGDCTSGDPSTNMVITGTVPAGTYNGLVLVNGIPDALNHGNPVNAPAPLQATGVTWGWLLGYRFLLAEVRRTEGLDGGLWVSDAGPTQQADGGVIPAPQGVGLMHLGSTACDGTEATGFSCSHANRTEVRLANFDPNKNTIVADLGAVFSLADLSKDVQCHGMGDDCPPMFQALGIDVNTGNPIGSQLVYRVE